VVSKLRFGQISNEQIFQINKNHFLSLVFTNHIAMETAHTPTEMREQTPPWPTPTPAKNGYQITNSPKVMVNQA